MMIVQYRTNNPEERERQHGHPVERTTATEGFGTHRGMRILSGTLILINNDRQHSAELLKAKTRIVAVARALVNNV